MLLYSGEETFCGFTFWHSLRSVWNKMNYPESNEIKLCKMHIPSKKKYHASPLIPRSALQTNLGAIFGHVYHARHKSPIKGVLFRMAKLYPGPLTWWIPPKGHMIGGVLDGGSDNDDRRQRKSTVQVRRHHTTPPLTGWLAQQIRQFQVLWRKQEKNVTISRALRVCFCLSMTIRPINIDPWPVAGRALSYRPASSYWSQSWWSTRKAWK